MDCGEQQCECFILKRRVVFQLQFRQGEGFGIFRYFYLIGEGKNLYIIEVKFFGFLILEINLVIIIVIIYKLNYILFLLEVMRNY